mmetsp:Transcript_7853/g.13681  ORF Transcript_7853/g.13681 Transcript_7853/m.13681 type:complete len:119 (+) Transcript_7853:475-831(+)
MTGTAVACHCQDNLLQTRNRQRETKQSCQYHYLLESFIATHKLPIPSSSTPKMQNASVNHFHLVQQHITNSLLPPNALPSIKRIYGDASHPAWSKAMIRYLVYTAPTYDLLQLSRPQH